MLYTHFFPIPNVKRNRELIPPASGQFLFPKEEEEDAFIFMPFPSQRAKALHTVAHIHSIYDCVRLEIGSIYQDQNGLNGRLVFTERRSWSNTYELGGSRGNIKEREGSREKP